MYDWRQMTAEDRAHVLDVRRARQLPWHSPPHLDLEGTHQYLISAACYEHAQIIGKSPERMTECEEALLKACHEFSLTTHFWCILPNHYHVLVTTEQIEELRRGLGRFHGRSSHAWNGEDSARGRKVWYNCFERPMKSRRHFLATEKLYPSQSRPPWLRADVAGLAVVKRERIPGASRTRASIRIVEAVSYYGLWKEVGYLRAFKSDESVRCSNEDKLKTI